MADRCVGTTKGGKPCSAKPLPGSDRCPWHSPEWDERRKAWSVRGGQNKSNRVRAAKRLPEGVLTVDQVRGLLGTALRDVLEGRLEPGPANAAAALARSYLAATEANAIVTLEEQVNDLRALIARRGSA